MSFDTEFDYSAAQSWLTARIASQQVIADGLGTEITDLQATTGYSSLVTPQVDQLNARKDRYDADIAKLNEVDGEITALTGLDAGDKTQIYDFWVLVQEPKESFMTRLLFNHAAILADTDFTALLADVTNDADQKKMIGELVCQKFPIDVRSTVIISRI